MWKKDFQSRRGNREAAQAFDFFMPAGAIEPPQRPKALPLAFIDINQVFARVPFGRIQSGVGPLYHVLDVLIDCAGLFDESGDPD
jgi:hypothetical protein